MAWPREAAQAAAIDARFAPTRVAYAGHPPGTIVIDTPARFLYHVGSGGYATRYGIGVGRQGLSMKGRAIVGRKAKWPSWTPTAEMIKRSPKKYKQYAKGLAGGPNNPLGARALYLFRDGRDTLYRIHGTNEPGSIGQAVSNGCIRMLNEHIERLYEVVPVGTQVVVR
ncbi:MAG TPA: L,D-transpeptidase [Bauldia sp.]|nr:L,D-transpeptidase [Bauldia sp.]